MSEVSLVTWLNSCVIVGVLSSSVFHRYIVANCHHAELNPQVFVFLPHSKDGKERPRIYPTHLLL